MNFCHSISASAKDENPQWDKGICKVVHWSHWMVLNLVESQWLALDWWKGHFPELFSIRSLSLFCLFFAPLDFCHLVSRVLQPCHDRTLATVMLTSTFGVQPFSLTPREAFIWDFFYEQVSQKGRWGESTRFHTYLYLSLQEAVKSSKKGFGGRGRTPSLKLCHTFSFFKWRLSFGFNSVYSL